MALRGNGGYRTDNGNVILDAVFAEGIADVALLDVSLNLIPGLVGHGLFVDMATEAVLGHADGRVETIVPPGDDARAGDD